MSRALVIAVTATLLLYLLSFGPTTGELKFILDIGAKSETFDHPPLINIDGKTYLSLEVLRKLAPYGTYVEEKLEFGPVEKDDSLGNSTATERIDNRKGTGDEQRISSSSVARLVESASVQSVRTEGADGEVNSEVPESIEVVPAPPSEGFSVRRVGLPTSFTLGNRKFRLEAEANRIYLLDQAGERLSQLHLTPDRILYLPESVLKALGLSLIYSPETSNFRLLGEVLSARYDKEHISLIVRTLVPSIGYVERVGDGRVRVEIEGSFVEGESKLSLPMEVAKGAVIANRIAGKAVIEITQDKETGFRLFAEDEPSNYFRLEFRNHFQLISYEKGSSGEIALEVRFSKGTEVKPSYITAPDRLVLDFPDSVYVDATKKVRVDVGGVKEIRVAQFQERPNVVRVVVELKRRLNYRVLRKDQGRVYYVQFLRREIRGSAVMLDAGHGGSDTGAIGVTRVYEKDLTLAITKKLERKLRAMGFTVFMTRTDDRFVSLGERADLANSLLPAIFVSIHANSIEDPGFSGVMSFHFNDSIEGNLIANFIQRSLVLGTGAIDRGTRTANFYILRETAVPAVLVEVGFMTNAYEESKLKDATYQELIADGVASGILNYFQRTGGP